VRFLLYKQAPGKPELLIDPHLSFHFFACDDQSILFPE